MKIEELKELSQAAADNAAALAKEAALLGAHGHFARAYFLAVASIEETGKAIAAHDAQGRNLANPAVVSRVERLIGDHKSKIRGAFMGFLCVNPREQAEKAAELMVALQNGREPAMYTDLAANGTISRPNAVVEEKHALSCVRLANDCLLAAKQNVLARPPEARSANEDHVFSLNPKHYNALMKNEDFWWYYISRMEQGYPNTHDAIVEYRRDFESKGRRFKPAEPAA
ncbi:AbiV family abortive infection protein [Lysobacter sp. N42]|uniref:AbiV family abortive infection protein n=1 Tax=Lysobacter sp. N42 TaxID=2545719 RepID=UPI00104A264C|nr:AbiV family abortive infection protein [Lysobacter sp. N42]TCZ78098.1 AbiV family abortive infection protein [Lysobacter sp. N42]